MKACGLLLIAFLFLPGCVVGPTNVVEDVWDTREKRTDDERRVLYVRKNPDLTEETATAILEGGILPGMSIEEIRASWGIPDREGSLTIDGTPRRVWEYGTVGIVFVDGVLSEFRDLAGR